MDVEENDGKDIQGFIIIPSFKLMISHMVGSFNIDSYNSQW